MINLVTGLAPIAHHVLWLDRSTLYIYHCSFSEKSLSFSFLLCRVARSRWLCTGGCLSSVLLLHVRRVGRSLRPRDTHPDHAAAPRLYLLYASFSYHPSKYLSALKKLPAYHSPSRLRKVYKMSSFVVSQQMKKTLEIVTSFLRHFLDFTPHDIASFINCSRHRC